jgi:protein phosphatase
MLLRAVGVEKDLTVDTGSLALQADDVLLLATDGLMNMVEDSYIAKAVAAAQNEPERLDDLAYTLVKQALEAGGTDNVTVIAVVYG